MKKYALMIASVLAFGLISAPAVASDWDYVGGGYVYASVEDNYNNRDLNADAVFVEVSKSLTDWLFVQGSFAKGNDADLDTSVVGLSLGLNKALDDATQIYGKVTASSVVENRYAYESYAYEAEAGVRAHVTDRIELRGGVIATDLRDARLDSVRYLGTAGVEFALTPSIRLGADVRSNGDDTEGKVGVRLYF